MSEVYAVQRDSDRKVNCIPCARSAISSAIPKLVGSVIILPLILTAFFLIGNATGYLTLLASNYEGGILLAMAALIGVYMSFVMAQYFWADFKSDTLLDSTRGSRPSNCTKCGVRLDG